MPFNCIVSLINNNNNNTRYPHTSSIHFQLLTPNRGKSLFLRISTEALSSTMELNIQIKLPFTTWSTQYNLLLLLPIDHRSTIDHRTIPDWTTKVFPRRNRVTVFIERFRIDMQNNFASSAFTITLLPMTDRYCPQRRRKAVGGRANHKGTVSSRT